MCAPGAVPSRHPGLPLLVGLGIWLLIAPLGSDNIGAFHTHPEKFFVSHFSYAVFHSYVMFHSYIPLDAFQLGVIFI